MAAKTIVVLADGTGNSASALFKTNVYRLYETIDQAPARRQIAYYHDGVGTSSFRPLALLGGAFGWGLKRNILDLYVYLCRNYRPGDRICAFGFSRGAFTVRLLVGLVAQEGLAVHRDEAELGRAARDAYRVFRRKFNVTGGLVAPLRWLRDTVIRLWRQGRGHRLYRDIEKREIERIDFVGVWDTVAAYGMPLAELAHGIDEWVWPLSMPNYVLSPKVAAARHALALDDERDTYHPLIWDEVAEEAMEKAGEVAKGRLRQVWFAGMHADVGGGYPDHSLSLVSLRWMMDEARAAAGLRFKAAAAAVAGDADAAGPMHDSRRGLAGYYRYQPRKIAARLRPPDETALVMQSPDARRALLTAVKVHASVLDRIRNGTDGYAPIVLPERYEVVGRGGARETRRDAQARAAKQDGVWNEVWKKRVNYFLTVGVSLILVALPAIHDRWPPEACEGPHCLIAPAIAAAGLLVPGFAEAWTESFARTPGVFALLVILLAALLVRSAALQRNIRDRMRVLWTAPLAAPDSGRSHWIFKLRTNRVYQRGLQYLKWRILPGAFGIAVLLGGAALVLGLGTVTYYRAGLAESERSHRLCATLARTDPGGAGFSTKAVCWNSGVDVWAGTPYRVTLTVTEPWFDSTIPASPLGFGSDKMSWYARFAFVLRRSVPDRWFQPMVKVVAPDGAARVYPLEMEPVDADKPVYVADFTPGVDGRAVLFVNDAVIDVKGLTRRFYDNNNGRATVAIAPKVVPPPAATPSR